MKLVATTRSSEEGHRDLRMVNQDEQVGTYLLLFIAMMGCLPKVGYAVPAVNWCYSNVSNKWYRAIELNGGAEAVSSLISGLLLGVEVTAWLIAVSGVTSLLSLYVKAVLTSIEHLTRTIYLNVTYLAGDEEEGRSNLVANPQKWNGAAEVLICTSNSFSCLYVDQPPLA